MNDWIIPLCNTYLGGHLIYFYSIIVYFYSISIVSWVQKSTLKADQCYTKLKPFSPTTSQKYIHIQQVKWIVISCMSMYVSEGRYDSFLSFGLT